GDLRSLLLCRRETVWSGQRARPGSWRRRRCRRARWPRGWTSSGAWKWERAVESDVHRYAREGRHLAASNGHGAWYVERYYAAVLPDGSAQGSPRRFR